MITIQQRTGHGLSGREWIYAHGNTNQQMSKFASSIFRISSNKKGVCALMQCPHPSAQHMLINFHSFCAVS